MKDKKERLKGVQFVLTCCTVSLPRRVTAAFLSINTCQSLDHQQRSSRASPAARLSVC